MFLLTGGFRLRRKTPFAIVCSLRYIFKVTKQQNREDESAATAGFLQRENKQILSFFF
jgi:hypothetical protein